MYQNKHFWNKKMNKNKLLELVIFDLFDKLRKYLSIKSFKLSLFATSIFDDANSKSCLKIGKVAHLTSEYFSELKIE